MLTIIKYCAAVVGTVAGITSVLLDYKDRITGRLTFGGKVAIGLIGLSLIISIAAQFLEDKSREQHNQEELQRKQQELIAAVARQTELIETIRAGTLPITESFDVELIYDLDETQDYVKPYFQRLRSKATKEPFVNETVYDSDPLAPTKRTERELRQHLDSQNLQVLGISLGLPQLGVMTIFASPTDMFQCTFGKARYRYEVNSEPVAVQVHAMTSVASIGISSKSFLSFGDMAEKKVQLLPRILDGLTPTKMILTSRGKQVIEGIGFTGELDKKNKRGDRTRVPFFNIVLPFPTEQYSATLGKMK